MSAPNILSRRTLFVAVAASAASLAWAQAQVQAPQQSVQATAAQAPARLTIRDIYDRVVAAGYHDLREIELDDGRYEVKAVDADGQPVKLYVNAGSGEVERIKRKAPDRSRADDRSSRSDAYRDHDRSREPATRSQPAAAYSGYYDYAMQPVANNAAPGQNAWGWRYFSDPQAYRAVVISPAGDYYLSQGSGLRWIHGTHMAS